MNPSTSTYPILPGGDYRDAQHKALEQLVHGKPLTQVLTTLVRNIELKAGGMLGSILLLRNEDEPRLYCGAAPSLPDEYNAFVEGMRIGPMAGSCGSAAYFKKRVVVEDTMTDPLWAKFSDVAVQHGLRACWSQPIFNSTGDVIGIFALYYHKPRRPTDSELELIDSFANIAALAIERKQAEEALGKSERENRALIENASFCIHQIDLQGRLISMNAAGLRMMNVTDIQDILGLRYLDLVSAKDRARIEGLLHVALGGQASEFEFETINGQMLASSFIPIFGDDHNVSRLMGISQDITERMHAEQARRELESQLRHSQKMEAIGQLAGGVAHDFNNLLTAILGNAEVLLGSLGDASEPLRIETLRPETLRTETLRTETLRTETLRTETLRTETLRAGLAEIQSASKQAASLTNKLLAFSRREVLRAEVVDPRRIIDEMQALLRRLIGEHIRMHVDLSAETGHVYAEPGQIDQIVMNLVVNAVDAMPRGGDLHIALEDVELDAPCTGSCGEAQAGRYVRLSVTDNGSGMTPDTLEHIYEPFFTTKPVGKGTGLGLATVYGTVKQLRGYIRGESTPDSGTTFWICLPAVDANIEQKKPETLPVDSNADETILVCEDEEMVRSVLCRTLKDAGFTVIEAENGSRALEAARAHDGSIDLLISDVIMPELSGQELSKRLAAEHPKTRVLFVSGYSADHLDAKGIQCGDTQLLQKPFGPCVLLRRVREILNAACTHA